MEKFKRLDNKVSFLGPGVAGNCEPGKDVQVATPNLIIYIYIYILIYTVYKKIASIII